MQGALLLTPGLLASPFRFLWHASSGTAILSDLHLGAEASLARAGIMTLDVYTPRLRAAWQRVVDQKPAQIVVAGDLFDTPAPGPAALRLCGEFLAAAPCPVTLTPGNHDPAASFLQQQFPSLAVVPFFQRDGLLITHGHIVPPVAPGATLIVGHQHPAVTFTTRVHSAKMLCFAHTPALIILPTFSPLPLGSNLLTAHHWIVDHPRPADGDLRIAGIIEKPKYEQVLDFGPLSALL